MASRAHQMILGLIARKMRQNGYEVVSFDGTESLIGDIEFKMPPTIGRHRPDIIGVDLEGERICIGEAKTLEDLSSNRTKEQFTDYSSLLMGGSKKKYELVIGIPQSAEMNLIKLLTSLGLAANSNVSYVWMPDELLK